MDQQSSPQRPSPRPSSGGSVSGWLVAILLILVAVLFFRLTGGNPSKLFDTNAQPRMVTARGDLSDAETSQIELFHAASPSVVYITTSTVAQDRFNLNLFEIPQGSGSGIVWDSDGHIVTNYHVIRGAQVAKVTLADGSSWNARYVGAAPDKDIAVLKIDAPQVRLTPILIGESANLEVGQKVFAIGNPFGLNLSLTTGVLSGLGREMQSPVKITIHNVIQTDAAINPGNSGGPLLDSAGRLIGINAAIYSPSGASAGIGFAIPVDTVNRIVPQLIRTGKIDQPGLGIHIWQDDIVAELVRRNVLPKTGVLVRDVVKQGVAAKAGMQGTRRNAEGRVRWGDLIVAIDDKPVAKTADLFAALQSYTVGTTVTVTVLRDGKPRKLQIELHALPSMKR